MLINVNMLNFIYEYYLKIIHVYVIHNMFLVLCLFLYLIAIIIIILGIYVVSFNI